MPDRSSSLHPAPPHGPSGVRLHLSNQTESLVARLAELLDEPSGGALEPETILVQGPGMATWLSMQLARRRGVCANVDFTYPRAFVWHAFRAYLGDERIEEAELTEATLFWLTLRHLPGLLGEPAFSTVNKYVARDDAGVRLFQLAQRIATAFDQYLIYRPELIRIWESGHDDGSGEHLWQPILWRAIRQDVRGHIAALEHEFLREVVDRDSVPRFALPNRISLFGTTSLPPLFLRVLTALGAHRSLHFFCFAPAAHDSPTPLLTSLGDQGREFRSLLIDAAADTSVSLQNNEMMVAPAEGHLLGALQQLIYRPLPRPADDRRTRAVGRRRARPAQNQLSLFRDAEPPSTSSKAATPPLPPLDPLDNSLQVHACHSPMREVEVLHNVLLALLDGDNDIKPHEVIVLTPDIETYAPLVDAVFASDATAGHAIPYRISDRSARADSAILDSLARIFELVDGRSSASDVVDLLTLAPIQKRFGVDATGLEMVTRWIAESGIRWGVDAQDRQAHEQPATENNTWRMGIDRLLIGYAWPNRGTETLAGVLPYDFIEGQQADLLGRLTEFTEVLFFHLAELRGSHSTAEWHRRCVAVLDALVFVDDDTSAESDRVRQTLALLEAEALAADFTGSMILPAFQTLLEARLDSGAPERGFLQNGVTFCAMLPMRTIPFRVICLLGMNDGAFPRGQPSVDFDLIASGPGGRKPGDRDRRRDDRQLFLEALMAARDHLVITFTGQSIRDNALRPPSVVISELLDALALCRNPHAAYRGEAERAERLAEEMVVMHPLQPFSPRYFDGQDPRLYAYSSAHSTAAGHLRQARQPSAPFFRSPLDELAKPPQASRTLELGSLASFWTNPHRALFAERLQLSLRNDEVELLQREPLVLDGLDRYHLNQRVLEHVEAGLAAKRSRQLIEAEGLLPPGWAGVLAFEERFDYIADLLASAAPYRVGEAAPPLRLRQLLGPGLYLDGEIRELYGRHRVIVQTSQIRAKHRLSLWLYHLALCLEWPTAESVLIGRAKKTDVVEVVRLASVSDPRPHLIDLSNLRDLGLRAPLLWSSDASWRFVSDKRRASESGDDNGERFALDAAVKQYRDELNNSDGYLEKVFGDSTPPFDGVCTVGPPFAELANRVLEPLLAHVIQEET